MAVPVGFEISPVVTVDGKEVAVRTASFEPKVYKYLAIVEPGEHEIEVSLVNFTSQKKITVKSGTITTLDFAFSALESRAC